MIFIQLDRVNWEVLDFCKGVLGFEDMGIPSCVIGLIEVCDVIKGRDELL